MLGSRSQSISVVRDVLKPLMIRGVIQAKKSLLRKEELACGQGIADCIYPGLVGESAQQLRNRDIREPPSKIHDVTRIFC